MSPRKPRTNGVERAFQVIEYLTETGESATAYQIAKEIGAPLSTIYESIALLEKMDIVARYGDDGKFFLGPRLVIYGLAYQRHLEADQIFRREAEALSRASGESVLVCMREGDYVVAAAVVDRSEQFQISTRPGSRAYLTWSASGMLLLGHLSPEDRREVFARARPSPSGRALTDPDRLEESVREAWERGWSLMEAESGFSVSCIAAPVRNPQGECVSTMCLVVPTRRAEEKVDDLVQLVAEAARNVERHLGWRNLSNGRGSTWRIM